MNEQQLSYQWAEWVMQNLANDASPEEVKNILRDTAGVTGAEAEKIVAGFLANANLEVYKGVREETKKREWLQTTLDALYRQKNKYLNGFISETLPDYETFLNDYYYENRPGLFQGAVNHWAAMNWKPAELKAKVGNPEIEVQFGRSKDDRYEQNGAKYKTKMGFHDFIDKVLNVDSSNDFYLTANNASASASKLAPMFEDIANLGDGYMDMEKLATQGFIWIGPKGTITPAHHDLTNNLFFQIYGRKRFWLVPSCQTPYIYNGDHVYSPVDLRNPDFEKFPELKKATIIQFDVHPGDFLFIPIGWWHAVESLDVSISFSSNAFADQDNDHFKTYPQGYNRY